MKLTEEQQTFTKLNMQKLPQIPDGYIRDPDMRRDAIARSITPRGFAEAFYKANR